MKGGDSMKTEYDFSNARKNPYLPKLKRQVTINLDCETVEYFKKLSESIGIPYQTLINLYLTDCAKSQKKPSVLWS